MRFSIVALALVVLAAPALAGAFVVESWWGKDMSLQELSD
jgi:hypothetical protein